MSLGRLEMIKSLANRIARCADQIKDLERKSRLETMKDILQELVDSEQEIAKLVTGRYSGVDHTEVLRHAFDESSNILNNGNRAIFAVNVALENNDKNILEIKKIFLKAKESVFKSLKQLDNYYKMNLNPKFHQHGLTAKDINKRMNDLRKLKFEMDRIV